MNAILAVNSLNHLLFVKFTAVAWRTSSHLDPEWPRATLFDASLLTLEPLVFERLFFCFVGDKL